MSEVYSTVFQLASWSTVFVFWSLVLLMGRFYFKVFFAQNAQKSKSNQYVNIALYFLATFILLTPVFLIASIFNLPSSIIVLFFILLLIPPVVFYERQSSLLNRGSILKIAFWIVIIIAGSLKGGALLSGSDAWVHIAHANNDLVNGYGVGDAYFPGIIDSRYIVNTVHGLITLASGLTGLSPLSIWYFSGGIFGAFAILAVVAITSTVFKSEKLAYSIGAASFIYAGFGDNIAIYPNKFAIYILMILVSVLVLRMKNYQKISVLLCLLLTLTHSGISVMAAVLLAFYMVALVLFENPFKEVLATIKKNMYLVFSIVLLLSVPLFTYLLLPNNSSEEYSMIGITSDMFYSLYGLRAFKIELYGSSLLGWLSAISAFVIVVYFITAKHLRKSRSLLITTVLFVFLTSSNFITFSILENFLPLWAIRRFSTINLFHEHIIFLTGLVILASTLLNRINKNKKITTLVYFIPLVVVLMLGQNPRVYVNQYFNDRDINSNGYEFGNELAGLDDIGSDSQTRAFVSSEFVSYSSPGVTKKKPLFINENHITPTVNYESMKLCKEDIKHKLDKGALMLPEDILLIVGGEHNKLYLDSSNYSLQGKLRVRTKVYYIFKSKLYNTQLPDECEYVNDIIKP